MSFNIRRFLLGLIDVAIYILVFIGTVTIIQVANPDLILEMDKYVYSALIFGFFLRIGIAE